MKMSSQQQEGIVALLTRIYGDIRDIEEEYQLLAGEDDFRPRIEHFHDAVRAFTSQEQTDSQSNPRLAIELLSYDLSCLRYIHSMPLSPFKPHGTKLSPKTDLVKVKQGLVVKSARPGRDVRDRLAELYQSYAVLFAALLKPVADRDYRARVEDMNRDVEDIHDLIHQLQGLAQGNGSLPKVEAAVHHLEEEGLRVELLNFIRQQKHKKKENLNKLVDFLKDHAHKKDKEIAGIEAVHMNYSLAQLGIFEGSKDLIKKMASQGMNLVGKFVEDAIAQSRREMGR